MYSNSSSYLGGANALRQGQQSPFGQQQSPFNTQQNGFGAQQMQPQYTGMPMQPQQTGYMQQQQQQPQPMMQQATGFGQPSLHALQAQQTGFGQSQPQTQFPQPTGLTSSMQPQPTGYGSSQSQQGLQSQPTGFAQPLQQRPQQTGYGGMAQQNYQSQQMPQFTGMQQPQQQQQLPQTSTFQQQPTQAQQADLRSTASPLQSTKTGMTSSQMANSFISSASPVKGTATGATKSSKIPSIRLSFITATDQAKFEQLFTSAVGNDQALTGDKAKELLLRSKLSGDALSQIWLLSDTTKSGQLLFPEFALSMYLCNLKLTGQNLPSSLPERIKNEVSSMVDIISFGIADDRAMQQSSNAPSFASPSTQTPQPTNSQLLSQLVSQPTGYQPQQPSFTPNSMQPQQTGYQQTTQMSMNTGFGMQPASLTSQPTAFAPLNSQPTGRPGQWGLVNAPAAGLPNLQALQNQMMPQPGRESGFTTSGLSGNATVPWAVTKDEKKIYDDMFKAWDGFGKGFVTGSQALEIFGQSGLDKADLERIWTLSDSNDRGRLNLDEFAVAMHLIYRRLNNYPVPNQLPPELIPPSTRNINDSIGTMKSMLSQDAQNRKNSGSFLQPQSTGPSYLKTRSFKSGATGRKDATVFKNDDNDVGYRSNARRRAGDGRSPASPQHDSPSREADSMNIDQLKKAVREKQILLDAMDFQGENAADDEDALDRKDRREADDLYGKIRRVQDDIDNHANSGSRDNDSDAERRDMQRQLRRLTDRLPTLASQVRKCERAIADAQVELFRMTDAKANPGSSTPVVGTGPNGEVTESDRLRARAKTMMQQRSAALTGKGGVSSDDGASSAKRIEEETRRARRVMEDNERMVKDVEDSVTDFGKTIEGNLREGGEDASKQHERRRWEDGLGVEDEVKNFIFDLQRDSRASRVRREETARPQAASASQVSRIEPSTTSKNASTSQADTPKTSYSSYKTAEERAAFIKQQAAARMAERLAALDIKQPSKQETPQQRQDREARESSERLKREEEDDARREQARQQRLADESIAPPPQANSKPVPPAPRKNRPSLSQQPSQQGGQQTSQSQEREQALMEQQQSQLAEAQALE